MCEFYKPCHVKNKLKPKRALTVLFLDCWQREYDKRPYRNFRFKVLDFEDRVERAYHRIDDFAVIIEFLSTRALSAAEFMGFSLPIRRNDLMQDFVKSVGKLRRLEMRLMCLPTTFFEILRDNVFLLRLKELVLEGSKLITADIKALREFLIESQILEHLNVARCNVTVYDFALLADGVHKSISMSSFNCSNLIDAHLTLDTPKIANTVSSLLWQNKLEELNMQYCEFHGDDMEVLSEYLDRTDCKLRKLNLSCNKIGPDGVEYLFNAITHSKNLTHLDISRNILGSPGGLVIAHNLSSCYFLEYLNISFNMIEAAEMTLILTTMNKSIPLRLIKVWGNKFDMKSADVLRRILDAKVIGRDDIDITAVYDESLGHYRVIPYY